MRRTGVKRLGDFTSELTLFPQVLVNVRLNKKFDFAGNASIMSAVTVAESELGGQGRVLLRASGTEPLIRVMVEGRDDGIVRRLADAIADAVTNAAAA